MSSTGLPLPLPGLAGLLDIRIRQVRSHELGLPDIDATMMVRAEHLAAAGYLHDGTV